MKISVITTNVFQGTDHVIALIKNLGNQSCKDFEWVFVDAYYDENRGVVSEMTRICGIDRVVHVPICAALHVGRQFHWEPYNNALLLSSGDIFLRIGVFRYVHHDVVKLALEHGEKGEWISLRQENVDFIDPNMSHEEIVKKHDMETTTIQTWKQMISHCGMFSFNKESMIEIGGNNEALVIHHWEDVDLNNRWTHFGEVVSISLEKAMLRVYHNKGNPYISKRYCKEPSNCIVYAKNSHELENYPQPDMEWVNYRDFPWARCPACGAIAVGHCDKYFEWLKQEPKALMAPVGVCGVGRNIKKLHADISKLNTIQSKIELLRTSHTDSIYLQE